MTAASRYEAMMPNSEKRAPRLLYSTPHDSTIHAVDIPVTTAPVVASATVVKGDAPGSR